MVVVAGEEPHVRTFPGKVEASRKAELAFQVSGLLVSLPVKEGQKVAKGEVIAQLRQDEFQARLKTLKSQLDQARAELRAQQAGERPEERLRRESQVRAAETRLAKAKIELDRYTRLWEARAGSKADLDRARTEYGVAIEDHKAAVQIFEKGMSGREEDIEAREAEVRAIEARVVEANIQLADSTLRAPFDGVIAKRFVEQNQNVMAKQPVVRFQDVDELDIRVDVPETVMAASFRLADIVSLVAEISGAPGLRFPVRIREIAQVADPTTQTFNVRVAMTAPPEARVLPGMTAAVTLTYRRASVLGERILVPIAAVFKQPAGEQVVWVLAPDGTVTPRPVKLGAASDERVEILDGLKPGDRIATAGVRFLRDQMKVRDLGDALGGEQP
jgi:RND family efflux transporter MFP subunit